MSDCCASSSCDKPQPKKRPCPVDGRECAEVSARTIAHHIKDAWRWQPSAQRYYFCDDPACEVVYFGEDGSTVLRSQMRTPVGAKESADDSLLCHCFGITRAALRDDPTTQDYVIAQTKAGVCSCATSNPSGRCCLKDFPQSDG